jgi:hypothetical protein
LLSGTTRVITCIWIVRRRASSQPGAKPLLGCQHRACDRRRPPRSSLQHQPGVELGAKSTGRCWRQFFGASEGWQPPPKQPGEVPDGPGGSTSWPPSPAFKRVPPPSCSSGPGCRPLRSAPPRFGAFHPRIARLPASPHRLGPTEDLLDPLASPLPDLVLTRLGKRSQDRLGLRGQHLVAPGRLWTQVARTRLPALGPGLRQRAPRIRPAPPPGS